MTDAWLERAAEAVHDAYLATCARLGWSVKPENAVPYAELSEAGKELDRASVRAVLAVVTLDAVVAEVVDAEREACEMAPVAMDPKPKDGVVNVAAWMQGFLDGVEAMRMAIRARSGSAGAR